MKCKNTNFSRVVVFLGSVRPLPFSPSFSSLPLPLPLLSSARRCQSLGLQLPPPLSPPHSPPFLSSHPWSAYNTHNTHPHTPPRPPSPPDRHHQLRRGAADPGSGNGRRASGRGAAPSQRTHGGDRSQGPLPPRLLPGRRLLAEGAPRRGLPASRAPCPLLTSIPGSSRPPTRAASGSCGVKRDKTNPALTVFAPPQLPSTFCFSVPPRESVGRGTRKRRAAQLRGAEEGRRCTRRCTILSNKPISKCLELGLRKGRGRQRLLGTGHGRGLSPAPRRCGPRAARSSGTSLLHL